jgi:hypothetical protein
VSRRPPGGWLPYLLAAANVALAVAAWTRQPWANGPAEWRWQYLPAGVARPAPAAALGVLAALAGLGILWGSRRLAAWRGALPLAVACGAAFTFALVAAQPGGWARVAGALASRNTFGFVWDAALAPGTGALLADYPAASAGLGQHSVTHPPGPLLVVRALGWLDRILPAPTPVPPAPARLAPPADRLPSPAGGLPALAAAAIEREVARARGHGRPVPREPPGPWAAAALAVLLPLASALAAWPLYRLGRCWGLGQRSALLAAALWLLVPARTLFTPSFDQALPALLAGAAWLAATGGRWRAAAAGGLLFAACFLSYGCLPVLPLVVACAVPRRRWLPRHALALGLGFALPYLALAVGAGHDPWNALRTALALHHQIAGGPRSYATWLLWNPYDFALLLSPAILGLAAAALFRPAPLPEPEAAMGPAQPPSRRLALWTWWLLLALLLLSGGVRGEVGRIWLVWMPFACLFAAAALAATAAAGGNGLDDSAGDGGGDGDAAPALVLATEAALTLALAASMVFVS